VSNKPDASAPSADFKPWAFTHRLVLFFLCTVVCTILVPVVGFFLSWDFLLMSPLFLFPYGFLASNGAGQVRLVESPWLVAMLNIGQWTLAGLFFAHVSRRFTFLESCAFAFALIVLISIVVSLFFHALGWWVHVELP
jgi:hypothetical protein